MCLLVANTIDFYIYMLVYAPTFSCHSNNLSDIEALSFDREQCNAQEDYTDIVNMQLLASAHPSTLGPLKV